MFGIDPLFALLFSFIAIPFRRLESKTLLILLILGVLGATVGSLAQVSYPWTDAVVLWIGVSAGICISRFFKSYRGFILFLIALSMLDVVQVLLTSASPAGGKEAVGSALMFGNFVIYGTLNFKIGIIDIAIICAMTDKLTSNGKVVSLLPGFIGLLVADMFVFLTGHGGIPLIPFLTSGFCVSVLVKRTEGRSHAM